MKDIKKRVAKANANGDVKRFITALRNSKGKGCILTQLNNEGVKDTPAAYHGALKRKFPVSFKEERDKNSKSCLRYLIDEAPPAVSPVVSPVVHTPSSRDSRLPVVGTVLTREYKGKKIAVTVLDKGFEYKGEVYRSLTAVADTVTGSHLNGYRFFGLK